MSRFDVIFLLIKFYCASIYQSFKNRKKKGEVLSAFKSVIESDPDLPDVVKEGLIKEYGRLL